LVKTEKRIAHTFHGDLLTPTCQHQSPYQTQSPFSEIHEVAEQIVLVISTQLRMRYEVRLIKELGVEHSLRLNLNMEYRRFRDMDCNFHRLGYLENN
jgi:hypothetical protein